MVVTTCTCTTRSKCTISLSFKVVFLVHIILLSNAVPCRAFSLQTIEVNNAGLLVDLPPQLQGAVDRGMLVQPRPGVLVLGTVHIGSESADEAALLLGALRPRTVVVEVAPSRLPLIRGRIKSKQEEDSNDPQATNGGGTPHARDGPLQPNRSNRSSSSSPPANQIRIETALRSLPALVQKGWSTGGVGGVIFATTILWGSLLKRAMTVKEESETLPRRDEFAATIEAADALGSGVVASDMEIDELIGAVARSMGPADWLSLAGSVLRESAGLQKADPIRRMKDESIAEWTERRRNIATARASKEHGEETAPGISRVLVDERDEIFAERCIEAIISREETFDSIEGVGNTIVCVVGLVHLDGVVERLKL